VVIFTSTTDWPTNSFRRYFKSWSQYRIGRLELGLSSLHWAFSGIFRDGVFKQSEAFHTPWSRDAAQSLWMSMSLWNVSSSLKRKKRLPKIIWKGNGC